MIKKYFWSNFEEKQESNNDEVEITLLMTMTKTAISEETSSDDADSFAINSNIGTLLTESSESSDRDIHSEDYHAIPLERNAL